MPNSVNGSDENLLWYKDAIIYELHIKAFMDANGDGIGDFKGLLSKLDYLEDLGVTAIWLLPFYPSPLRDDGYDIMDYYTINPSYGKVKHFKKFVKAAHKRNIRVITELVINHTSDQHPWFQQARRAPKGSVERDYYVWSDDPKKYKGARIIFQDYEASNWTYDPVAGEYFWHRFFHHQPDLNYENPQVQEEVFKIIDYWADMGVDGFRLDAVPYLYQREGTNCENLPETHDFLKKLRSHLDKNHTGKMLLAEANMWPEDSASYFGEGDECHMNYHFPIMPRMFMAMRMEDRYPITDIFDQTPEIPENCQWAIFLRNHDELTLEMVTDEERDYMYKVYAQNPKAKINLGLRRRLAPLLDNNRKKIELLNTLLYSLPGTPVIYYGDEIGMGDNFYLGDRDGVRTPMQWSPDRNAGFSVANPQKLYLPVILDPEHHYESVNVETQYSNGSSLLWWTKRIINMRKKFKAFSRGDMKFIHSENTKVLCFTRTYEEEIILIVINLSRFAQAAALDLTAYAGSIPIEVFSKNEFPPISESNDYTFTLSPHAYHWFLLKNELVMGEDKHVVLEAESFKKITSGSGKNLLEEQILPRYILNSSWHQGGNRKMQGTHIIEKALIRSGETNFYLIIVEVSYETGLSDLYQMGMAFGEKTDSRIVEQYPQSLICEATIDGVSGYLYDALYAPDLHIEFFRSIAGNQKTKSDHGFIGFFDEKKKISKYLQSEKEIKPRLILSRRSNASVIYNNEFYLKTYRKLDRAINPDLEIVRFVGDQKGFKNIPPVIATIQLEYTKEDSIVLAMMQPAVKYQDDMWSHLLDFLERYYEKIQLMAERDRSKPLEGSIEQPISYEEINDEEIKGLLGMVSSENIRLLGERTAELHFALGSDTNNTNFAPEEFSLHYQRSLFSSFQSMVRGTFELLNKQLKNLPEDIQKDAKELYTFKDELLSQLKQVYETKMDIYKIRTHGDYHLQQVLFTGQDYIFIDFEGEASKSYSERRLKKSPIRDVASMIRSFHYAAYESILSNENIRSTEYNQLVPWVEKWYHYMSQVFLRAYLEASKGNAFIPEKPADMKQMLNVFILERALVELKSELSEPSKRLLIPMIAIKQILGK